jgi:hypothetical protein
VVQLPQLYQSFQLVIIIQTDARFPKMPAGKRMGSEGKMSGDDDLGPLLGTVISNAKPLGICVCSPCEHRCRQAAVATSSTRRGRSAIMQDRMIIAARVIPLGRRLGVHLRYSDRKHIVYPVGGRGDAEDASSSGLGAVRQRLSRPSSRSHSALHSFSFAAVNGTSSSCLVAAPTSPPSAAARSGAARVKGVTDAGPVAIQALAGSVTSFMRLHEGRGVVEWGRVAGEMADRIVIPRKIDSCKFINGIVQKYKRATLPRGQPRQRLPRLLWHIPPRFRAPLPADVSLSQTGLG